MFFFNNFSIGKLIVFVIFESLKLLFTIKTSLLKKTLSNIVENLKKFVNLRIKLTYCIAKLCDNFNFLIFLKIFIVNFAKSLDKGFITEMFFSSRIIISSLRFFLNKISGEDVQITIL